MLGTILQSELDKFVDPKLLVGNETADDAAVYDIGNGLAIISTTDFFMPIVDDPFDFGRIAATNALSDIFAMGGKPLMAIAILGFPIDKLPAEVAQKIIEGGRFACQQAGIVLAGGHSIHSMEPIFGLAVTGMAAIEHIKRNASATAGCELFLTKPLGIGILTTAEKRGLLTLPHQHLVRDLMCQLNTIGTLLAPLPEMTAMTDITGFGLLGHLSEICQASNVRAEINSHAVKVIDGVEEYVAQGMIPGGTQRNFESYANLVSPLSDRQKAILCDQQTSGGLLIAVELQAVEKIQQIAQQIGSMLFHIGKLFDRAPDKALIEVN
ncbi:selenide,water dikinase SelD [[Haemophilus] ducreyi]|nr:selenide,water dikinase SelD [[Haemophilus] ducreyi]ANF72560.1 selenide,water dikinase SelD [[Haemophilus] ducreyi]